MKRRKKKVNTQQLKQAYSARLNIYKQRIIHYLHLMDCDEVAAVMDKSTVEAMYRTRIRTLPKIHFSEGVVADHQTKHEVQSDLDVMISDKTIELYKDGPMASALDVISYLTVIYCFVKVKEQDADAKVLRLVHLFNDRAPDITALYDKAYRNVNSVMSFLGLIMTHATERLCWMEINSEKRPLGLSDYDIEVKEVVPESRILVIDDRPRPVFRFTLAFANRGPVEVSVSADKLNLDKSIGMSPIPVYVQNHLMHRLAERIDCIPEFLRQFYLYHSFEDPKVIHYKGRMLVEYNIEERNKLGYLLVDYIEGVLLVKTFLLLSNNGTPEGQKLEEISGLKKIDRQYWAIDRLSTFQHSDMKDNPKVREVFEKSGCGTLFNDLSFSEDEDIQHTTQAQQMLKFLMLKDEEEEVPAGM